MRILPYAFILLMGGLSLAVAATSSALPMTQVFSSSPMVPSGADPL